MCTAAVFNSSAPPATLHCGASSPSVTRILYRVCHSASLVVQSHKVRGCSTQHNLPFCFDSGSDDLHVTSYLFQICHPRTSVDAADGFHHFIRDDSLFVQREQGQVSIHKQLTALSVLSEQLTSVNLHTGSGNPKSLMNLPKVFSQSERSWRHLFQAMSTGVPGSSL